MMQQVPYGLKSREAAITDTEYTAFFAALEAGNAKIALRLPSAPDPQEALGPEREFARQARDRLSNIAFINVSPALAALRQIKTPYEQTVLTRSVEISSEAHLAGMKAARPGRFEYRGGGGDRAGIPGERGDVPGVSVDCRQRPERHHPALQRLEPAHGGGRPAAGRRGGQFPGPDGRHHADLPGEREVHRRATRNLWHRARRTGGRDRGRTRRQPHRGHREGRPGCRQAGAAEAGADHRHGGRSVPDVVHAWHLPLDRHGRA